MRPLITVVNPHHWLKEDGDFPENPRIRARALRVAQCIEYGGPLPRGHARETLIPCRRRPGNQPCRGLLWVLKQEDGAIHAFCQVCKADEYMIYEWEETLWAEGPMESIDVDAIARERGVSPPAAGTGDREVAPARALPIAGSTLGTDEVRQIIERSENDPCPCGSGVKYKRCCLSKTLH